MSYDKSTAEKVEINESQHIKSSDKEWKVQNNNSHIAEDQQNIVITVLMWLWYLRGKKHHKQETKAISNGKQGHLLTESGLQIRVLYPPKLSYLKENVK